MRSFILNVALAALAATTPVPQNMDLDMVDAAPDPTYTIAVGVDSQIVSYNTQAIVAQATSVTSVTVNAVEAAATDGAAVVKRGTCASQPAGAPGAPVPSPDTPSAFTSFSSFAAAASGAPTPSGYDRTFQNLAASNNAYGYMGFTTLDSYDSKACASKCNAITGCMAINIYFERDPSLDPGASCPNPPSVTQIKCVFWGGPVSAGNANNQGQFRQDFQVVIAGSNGYVSKKIATPAGYQTPTYLGDVAINAPLDSEGYDTYMGAKIFTTGPFNIQLCADYCTAQNVYNRAHPPTDGSPVQTCQFFNTYILYMNTLAKPQGQYCSIYSEAWGSQYATNNGQYRGSDHYIIGSSYTSTNPSGLVSPNKQGAIYQARRDITYSSLQPYCSTFLGFTVATVTTTSTSTITPATVTPFTTITVTTTTTSTPALQKRDTTPSIFDEIITTSSGYVLHLLQTGGPSTTLAKRAAATTPDGLTKYPGTVISSACSLVATPPTTTATSTVPTTITAVAQTAPLATVTAISTTTVVVAACSVPTFPYTGGSFCGSTYSASSGRSIASAEDLISFGTYFSLAACIDDCDQYSNCYGVQYQCSTGDCFVSINEERLVGDRTPGYNVVNRDTGTTNPPRKCYFTPA